MSDEMKPIEPLPKRPLKKTEAHVLLELKDVKRVWVAVKEGLVETPHGSMDGGIVGAFLEYDDMYVPIHYKLVEGGMEWVRGKETGKDEKEADLIAMSINDHYKEIREVLGWFDE